MAEVNALREALASAYLREMLPLHQALVPVPGETCADLPGVYDNSYRLPDKPLPFSCSDEEGILLDYLIRANGLRHGFEIATAFGFSSLAMGAAFRANKGRLTGMDCYVEEEESIYYKPALVEAASRRVRERIEKEGILPRGLEFARYHADSMGLTDTISYVVGASPINVVAHLEHVPLDLVFIDGGHFGDQPLLDFLVVVPFLSQERCAVFFHDFSPDSGDIIGRAVAEAERRLGTRAVILPTRWNLTLVGRGLEPASVEQLQQLPWRSNVAPASPSQERRAAELTLPVPPSPRTSPTRPTITPEQISVVVQGAVIGKADAPEEHQLTRLCLESIRRVLPGAEVILSTWPDSAVEGLSYDVLLENDDPGGVCFHTPAPNGVVVLNNVNRQIVSTRAGLMASTRPYALKIRSDFALLGAGFLDYFGLYPRRAEAWRLVRERVLACTVYARNPRRLFPFAFHPSDWVFFGLRADMLGIWNIPLAPEPESSRWFETRPRPEPDYFPGALNRFTPEQYIWLNFLRKHGEVPLEHQWEISPEILALSELTIANNLTLLEPWQWQIHTNKPRLKAIDGQTIYTHGDWRRLYKRYCAPRTMPGPDWTRLARTTRYRLSESRSAVKEAQQRIFPR